MISIKVDVNDALNIVSCLNIIILKYMEKNGSLDNAVVLIPSVAYQPMIGKYKKEELKDMGIKSLYGWVKLVEDKNIKDELIIIDKDFFNFTGGHNEL